MKKKSNRSALLFGAVGTVASVNVWLAAVGLSLLTACHGGPQPLPQAACTRLAAYDAYPDSSFFQDIRQLQVADSVLYAFDYTLGHVAVWNLRTNDFYTCGTLGQGPEEVVQPQGFCLAGDTVYMATTDEKLKGYVPGGRFAGAMDVPMWSEKRFFLLGDTVYATFPTDSSCYVKSSRSWKLADTLHGLRLGGHLFPIKDESGPNLSPNARHLVRGDGGFYAVCPSYPVVEKYDLHTGRLLEACDLSTTEFVSQILSYVNAQPTQQNSYFHYLDDACWHDGRLYILCADWQEGYSLNKILVLDTRPALRPVGICQLPGDVYSCIAVEGDTVYAFNSQDCTIEVCRMEGWR